MQYPDKLIPRLKYSKISFNNSLLGYFLRAVHQDLEAYYEDEEYTQDVIYLISGPAGLKDVFEMSLSLYGPVTRDDCKIRVRDLSLTGDWDGVEELDSANIECAPFYKDSLILKASYIYNKEVKTEKASSDIESIISFEHKPTRSNFWHFQVFICDKKTQTRYPRQTDSAWLKAIANKALSDVFYLALTHSSEINQDFVFKIPV